MGTAICTNTTPLHPVATKDAFMTQPSSTSKVNDILSIHNVLLSSDFGIWLWEPGTGTLYFNAQYMSMLGYEHTAFPFHISTWEQLIHPEDRAKTVHMQVELLADPAKGDSFESRFRFLAASGEYVWILGKGFVLCRDENGHAIRVSGMHVDLMNLTRSLDALATEHDRMTFALEAARDGLWDWNPETGDVYFSPRYISMLGYTEEEFPPHVDSWVKHVHPDDLKASVEMQYAHISNPHAGDMFECTYRFRAADGSYKWILGRGKVTRRNSQGVGTRVVGLHTDITELRETQETLSQLLNLDTLTRLYSRFFFDCALSSLQDQDYPASLIFGDLDGLKLVNDTMGHAAGDTLLVTAASLLRESVGRNTVVARLGGDEFAVLLRGCPEDKAADILERIQNTFDRHNAATADLPVFISLGVISAARPISGHRLLAMADSNMLCAKSRQRMANHMQLRLWIEEKTGQPITSVDPRLGGGQIC